MWVMFPKLSNLQAMDVNILNIWDSHNIICHSLILANRHLETLTISPCFTTNNELIMINNIKNMLNTCINNKVNLNYYFEDRIDVLKNWDIRYPLPNKLQCWLLESEHWLLDVKCFEETFNIIINKLMNKKYNEFSISLLYDLLNILQKIAKNIKIRNEDKDYVAKCIINIIKKLNKRKSIDYYMKNTFLLNVIKLLNINLTKDEDIIALMTYVKLNGNVYDFSNYYVSFCKDHIELAQKIYGNDFENFCIGSKKDNNKYRQK